MKGQILDGNVSGYLKDTDIRACIVAENFGCLMQKLGTIVTPKDEIAAMFLSEAKA